MSSNENTISLSRAKLNWTSGIIVSLIAYVLGVYTVAQFL